MAVHEQRGELLEAEKTKEKPPPLYKVLLLNDDYTPMDFVVVVLQTVFGMTREKATRVMLQVHREAFLVPIENREEAGSRAFQAPRVVAGRRLHLDDFGAEVRQHEPAGGAHDHVGELDDPYALKRPHEILLAGRPWAYGRRPAPPGCPG